jgi:hypothetical protein
MKFTHSVYRIFTSIKYRITASKVMFASLSGTSRALSVLGDSVSDSLGDSVAPLVARPSTTGVHRLTRAVVDAGASTAVAGGTGVGMRVRVKVVGKVGAKKRRSIAKRVRLKIKLTSVELSVRLGITKTN